VREVVVLRSSGFRRVNLHNLTALMSKLARDNYRVLVADDSAEDRMLLKAAIRATGRLQCIGEVSDGSETIAYLKGHAGFGNREKYPMPDLLLLDLMMPGKDGFEVLKWLGARQLRKLLTVVVLTSSMEPEDIKRALDLGADLFQVKPRSHHDRQAMVLALEEYLANSPLASIRSATGRIAGVSALEVQLAGTP
jgi:CheY-like chemotaxis protein